MTDLLYFSTDWWNRLKASLAVSPFGPEDVVISASDSSDFDALAPSLLKYYLIRLLIDPDGAKW